MMMAQRMMDLKEIARRKSTRPLRRTRAPTISFLASRSKTHFFKHFQSVTMSDQSFLRLRGIPSDDVTS
jgi:hypothetical protein